MGFVLTHPEKVLVRALGPSVQSAFGQVIGDPLLRIYDINLNVISENDNWKDNPAKGEIEQTGLAPSNDYESAVIVELDPGLYSVEAVSARGEAGNLLVELYSLGQASAVYDDFTLSVLDAEKWNITAGNPVTVDGQYLQCVTSTYVESGRTYLCSISSTSSDYEWGVALQETPGVTESPLFVRRCLGRKEGVKVCAEFEVMSNRNVYARIVQEGADGLPQAVTFSEKIGTLSTGAFVSFAVDMVSRTVSFVFSSQGTDTIITVARSFGDLEEVFSQSPLVIYSTGTSPSKRSFLVDYVEN